jgi:hypothetical protein
MEQSHSWEIISYGTRKCFTVLTRACHWSLSSARIIHSIYSYEAWHFWGTYRLHLQNQKVNWAKTQEKQAVGLLVLLFDPEDRGDCSSQMSACLLIARRYKPYDHSLHIDCRENLKSKILTIKYDILMNLRLPTVINSWHSHLGPHPHRAFGDTWFAWMPNISSSCHLVLRPPYVTVFRFSRISLSQSGLPTPPPQKNSL